MQVRPALQETVPRANGFHTHHTHPKLLSLVEGETEGAQSCYHQIQVAGQVVRLALENLNRSVLRLWPGPLTHPQCQSPSGFADLSPSKFRERAPLLPFSSVALLPIGKIVASSLRVLQRAPSCLKQGIIVTIK